MCETIDPTGPSTRSKPGQIDLPGFEIGPDDLVVDVGCGYDAPVCVYAGWKGAEVVAVDLDPAQLDCARRVMDGVPARSFRAVLSDANPLPLPDETATVVVATEVVEHVADPRAFVAELARIGSPGARYVISVPHPTSEGVMRRIAPSWYFEPPFHVNVFGPGELDALIEGSGLVVEERHDRGFYWSMHWFLRMAVGMVDPWEGRPDHRALDLWDELAAELAGLAANPRGAELIPLLDHLIPKSQVRIARKPERIASTAPDRMAEGDRVRGLKDWVRDGGVGLGGYRLSWRVRRVGGRLSG